MRWPWQRPPEQNTVAVESRPSPAGWAFLPPLVGTPAPAPATLRRDFVSTLPTRALPVQLTSLGHLVTDDAPGATIGFDTGATSAPAHLVASVWGGQVPATWRSPGRLVLLPCPVCDRHPCHSPSPRHRLPVGLLPPSFSARRRRETPSDRRRGRAVTMLPAHRVRGR